MSSLIIIIYTIIVYRYCDSETIVRPHITVCTHAMLGFVEFE